MRAYSIYLLMVVVFAAGLWLVLGFGSALTPPVHLGGTWELTTLGRAVAPPAIEMTVEQSGQFLRVGIYERSLDLRMTSSPRASLQDPVVISDGQTTLTLTPTNSPHRYRIDAIGEVAGQFDARRRSGSLPGDTEQPKQAPSASAHGLVYSLLVQVVLILALSRGMGLIFARLHQPQVMGEMVAGIMLGPSLFGLLFPGAAAWVFPADSVPYLNVLSQIGVIFFLFLVGLELEPKHLKNRGHTALVMSHISIIAPFLLGGIVALYLYRLVFHDAPRMTFTSVALFMGAAMSITAFPVLARILTERNLHKTNVGVLTITCAAVDDVTAWCMLAFVIGIARADGWMPGLTTAGLSAVYVLVMFLVVRPFLKRLQVVHDRQGRLSQPVVALIFLLTLASAWVTEAIGIHALFGAFLMGALMPKGTQFVRTLTEKLEDFVVIVLLPIFFAYTGLRTQIGLLNSPALWMDTLLIITVACLGKFGGCAVAGRALGLPWRESSAVGVLMNTRGLMELVILNIGLQEGVITPAVFAMMVIMALATTSLTTPLLSLIYPRQLFDEEKARAGKAPGFSVLIPVSLPESGPALARLAAALVGKPEAGGKLVALHLRRPEEAQPFGASAEEIAPAQQDALRPLLEEAAELRLAVDADSFPSRDVAGDIATVAAGRRIDLVLMGFHKPVIGKTILGGTVHRVMNQCESDVGVFVDRGSERLGRILVPYLGSPHDRLGLDLAARMARNAGAEVTVLHVVPPMRGVGRKSLDVKGTIERTFAESKQARPATIRVIEDDSPVAVVLREAAQYDLVVLGVSEEWGLESRLFGWRAERIARECPASLLIVRKSTVSAVAAPAPQPAPASVAT